MEFSCLPFGAPAPTLPPPCPNCLPIRSRLPKARSCRPCRKAAQTPWRRNRPPRARTALARAQAFARQATAPATLRAYKADWQHFSRWCAARGFVPVPAEPAVVGAYLASLAESHAPSTIRRRLAALGKMHRFNDLPWNPAHRDIQGPLRGLLRRHGRPAQRRPR